MQPLRFRHLIARLALAWFALALGVAAASPLVRPRALQLVCSAGGVAVLVVEGDDGHAPSGHGQLDCALCLLADAPPPVHTAARPCAPRAAPTRVAVRTDAPGRPLARAPLPARGPPPAIYS